MLRVVENLCFLIRMAVTREPLPELLEVKINFLGKSVNYRVADDFSYMLRFRDFIAQEQF